MVMILHAWVIKNNHVHLIVSASEGCKLEDILRDHKKFTAKGLLDAISQNAKESRKRWLMWLFRSAGSNNSNNTHYQFWQQDNHPIELVTPAMVFQKLEYIHQNPVRDGIVCLPEQYVYSSAIDYTTSVKARLSLVKIERVGY